MIFSVVAKKGESIPKSLAMKDRWVENGHDWFEENFSFGRGDEVKLFNFISCCRVVYLSHVIPLFLSWIFDRSDR